MTTKKFAKYLEKQCKAVINFSLEPMFEDYIAQVNGKRIGVAYSDKFYVMYAPKSVRFKAIMPDVEPVNPFGWGYYKLVEIENLDDSEKLKELVMAVYNDLHFENEFVMDIAALFYSYQSYPEIVEKIYNMHLTFLRFCHEKGLLQMNVVDSHDRILKMHFTNADLTDSGQQIVAQLHRKWLIYNDKNDNRTPIRLNDVKKLEKFYQELV
ncbi:hypothetical protein [Capnocytophaga sp.]|uniref:hypothetical protein n=1 Tax=Capnocytophaga sp. TaxID=44737 RepID=UPI0026DD18E1|nr:hypothetical protein [Capnocytophaga sp.]MDO5105258.1 hypothetical protein [Capnocytophaga sp.]